MCLMTKIQLLEIVCTANHAIMKRKRRPRWMAGLCPVTSRGKFQVHFTRPGKVRAPARAWLLATVFVYLAESCIVRH